MTVIIYLRNNQSGPLTWSQVDTNFTNLANQINANTNAISNIGAPQGGPMANRPNPPLLFQQYFDTDLGFTVTCKQVAPPIWVDSAGAQV